MMKFSIIIPVYNREKTIGDAIRSVVDQTYSTWELILINDGSTDLSLEICEKFAKQDKRIFFFSQNNAGVSSARNLGLSFATGDFVLFLDSDNSLKSNALEELNKKIIRYPEIDFAVFGYNVSKMSYWIPSEKECLLSVDDICKKYLPTHLNIYPQNKYYLKNYVWNKAFRRHFLIKNSIQFDANRKLGEDGKYIINCLDKAKLVLLLPEIIYNAFCNKDVNHLSSYIYLDRIIWYIDDEMEYKKRFSEKVDFSTEHYISSNLNNLHIIMQKTIEKYGNKSKKVISIMVRSEIVRYWLLKFKPIRRNEKYLKKKMLDENIEAIYRYFRFLIIKDKPTRIKKFVKRFRMKLLESGNN